MARTTHTEENECRVDTSAAACKPMSQPHRRCHRWVNPAHLLKKTNVCCHRWVNPAHQLKKTNGWMTLVPAAHVAGIAAHLLKKTSVWMALVPAAHVAGVAADG
jgi:hypothetical protein